MNSEIYFKILFRRRNNVTESITFSVNPRVDWQIGGTI